VVVDICFGPGFAEISWRSSRRCHLLQYGLESEEDCNDWIQNECFWEQHVLWKWESDTLPGQPSNVKFGKWLPQFDILREYCYSGKTVGISCMRDGTYWGQWLRISLAYF